MFKAQLIKTDLLFGKKPITVPTNVLVEENKPNEFTSPSDGTVYGTTRSGKYRPMLSFSLGAIGAFAAVLTSTYVLVQHNIETRESEKARDPVGSLITSSEAQPDAFRPGEKAVLANMDVLIKKYTP